MAYEQPSVHALAFRVMRLSKPGLHLQAPLRVDLDHDMTADGPGCATSAPASPEPLDHKAMPFAERVALADPVQLAGLTGLLDLPQSFGTIYLGESFSSYISVGNYSDHEVTFVGIKAELQTERQKAVLYDNTANPLPSMVPGGRHDFIIKHDVKELGPHTLVCSTVYTAPDGERKFMPQFFKFAASNPLSVRTKTRQVLDSVFLEACLENGTKSPMVLEYVRFDPAPGMAAEMIDARDALRERGGVAGPLSDAINSMQTIDASGGARNFLFRVRRALRSAGRAGKEGTNTLGKLEIKWRNPMGEMGRLQTQQIMGLPDAYKEVELALDLVPQRVRLGQPFSVALRVRSNVERRVGPLTVGVAPQPGVEGKAGVQGATVVVAGHDSVAVGELEPHAVSTVALQLLALRPGVQRLVGIQLYDAREVKVFDTLNNIEVFVET